MENTPQLLDFKRYSRTFPFGRLTPKVSLRAQVTLPARASLTWLPYSSARRDADVKTSCDVRTSASRRASWASCRGRWLGGGSQLKSSSLLPKACLNPVCQLLAGASWRKRRREWWRRRFSGPSPDDSVARGDVDACGSGLLAQMRARGLGHPGGASGAARASPRADPGSCSRVQGSGQELQLRGPQGDRPWVSRQPSFKTWEGAVGGFGSVSAFLGVPVNAGCASVKGAGSARVSDSVAHQCDLGQVTP